MRLEIPVGERAIVLETGKLAKQAGGSVTARLGDTMVLSTATRSPGAPTGATFLPLRTSRRGCPRPARSPAALSSGGQAFREGDPDLPPHGQAPEAALPQGLPLRDTGHRDRSRRRPGDAVTTPSAWSAPRRRSRSPTCLRARSGPCASGASPTAASSSTYLPADRRERPGPRRRGTKEAITMVEAGANEVTEDVMVEALSWPRRSSASRPRP